MFEVTMCKRESRKWAQSWVSFILVKLMFPLKEGGEKKEEGVPCCLKLKTKLP
jgi:hypothetical protein